MQGNYVPGMPLNPTSTALKTVHISIHVWRTDEGDAAVIPFLAPLSGPANTATLKAMIEDFMPSYYTSVELPTFPIPGHDYESVTDSKVRFVVDNVYFNDNTDDWIASGAGSSAGFGLTDRAIELHPESEGTLHLHYQAVWAIETNNGASGYAKMPTLNDFGAHSWFGISPASNSTTLGYGEVGGWQGTLAHELGHIFGFAHLYGGSGIFGIDECNIANAENFIFDFFGTTNPPWCETPLTGCTVGMAAACTTGVCPNNLMSQSWPGPNNSSITPLQMGRMHRNLMVANIAKYAWGYDPVPYTLAQSETWDFPVKFYQDIVVPAGRTLTVKCELHMVPEASIIVEPGGRLVIDGGVVKHALFAPDPWQGVQIWGNSLQSQAEGSGGYLLHQGLVEIKNGGRIEGAETGVYLGKPGDPTKAGGVLRMEGTGPIIDPATFRLDPGVGRG